jgi:signal transduction histidine kinase
MTKPLPKLIACIASLLLAVCAWAVGGSERAGPAVGSEVAIDFTAEERAWIAAHPVIRVGHDPSYSPYAIQESSGRIVGLDPDYMELFARLTGLKFHNETRRDWSTMLEDFKAGQVDLLPSIGYDKEREQFLIYTKSYAFAPNVIITRNDAPYLFSLSELKGRTISIPRGYSGLRSDLNKSAPGNTVVEYDTSLDCYQAVVKGEVYASIGDAANATYLIKTNSLTSLRLGSVISASSEIYLGVRKDWPMLAQILNKALASVTTEDRLQINSRWVPLDYAADWRWASAFRVAAGIAAAAVIVFLFVFFHNRRLARELAERRRIQTELEQTRDRLVQASQEKSELMHMVAHDLRSPLTGIQLGVELLQLDPPLTGPELTATIVRVKESAGQMARLINDLLSAQNVEEGHFSLKFLPGDAVPLAHAAVAALRTAAQHKRIAVEARLPAAPVPLTTDFVALQQVVDNLLSNALKYSPPGSRVEVSLVANATHCRFEVRDQGPGVTPAEREQIFEKFGRGSAKPTSGEESIGLGLWIVRRFVLALHGRVWCESGAGDVGSVFVVEVPLVPPAVA